MWQILKILIILQKNVDKGIQASYNSDIVINYKITRSNFGK